MRRDLMFGMILSVLLHGGFAGIGQWLKEGPRLIQKFTEASLVPLPFVEPEPEPEPEQRDDEDRDVVRPTLLPPMLPEIPPIPRERAIPQPPVPVPTDLPREGLGVIPRERLVGNGDRIFDLSSLDQIPRATYQAQPIYPAAMRTRGVTGTVQVEFVVEATGRVASAYAVRSSQREFEAEAVKAVTGWKFKPGLKGGRPVPTRMIVEIQFTLKNQ